MVFLLSSRQQTASKVPVFAGKVFCCVYQFLFPFKLTLLKVNSPFVEKLAPKHVLIDEDS